MSGIVVFSSLAEAVRAGFEPYEQTAAGYIVRVRTRTGWALAFVATGGRFQD